ncbi:MAG TPA: hypothetical protein VMW69_08395 [Spirochaetia bacterium]|nr:hypothetical protein [Spirochaetia bacterium]
MRHAYKLFGAVLLAVTLAGCASFQSVTRSSSQNGAIFGYIDLPSDHFGYFNAMSIMAYPGKIRAYMGIPTDVHYVIRDGAFFAYNAEPGQYYLLQVYSSSQPGLVQVGYHKDYSFSLMDLKMGDKEHNAAEIKKHLFTVQPGQLLYLGANSIYAGKREGLFSNGTFSVGPDKAISEKQVLEKLLPALKGTPWEKPVEDRIASL